MIKSLYLYVEEPSFAIKTQGTTDLTPASSHLCRHAEKNGQVAMPYIQRYWTRYLHFNSITSECNRSAPQISLNSGLN